MTTQVPKQLIAGDTWEWTSDYSEFPAPTWVVTYYFENAAGTFNAIASASGSQHAVSVPATTTDDLKPGRYNWYARAVLGAVAKTVESGFLEVLADPAAAGGKDRRSWARRTLEAVEATIETRATDGQLAMSVGGRSLSRIPLSELFELQTQLQTKVRTEELADTAGMSRHIRVRAGRA